MGDYLFHYTNLEALALILKNHTIRLNSLKNMDDAEEVKTANSDFLGKYCFVSSWTDIEEESIPFWGIYTNRMTGVRLKMRKNPFETDTIRVDYFDGGYVNTPCPKEILEHYPVYLYPPFPFLRKVEYVNENTQIIPDVIDYIQINPDGTHNFTGNFLDIGKYKRDCWAFQSEYRYGLLFIPHDGNGRFRMDLRNNANDMPFWHLDLRISDEAFQDIEIMTGPRMSQGDKVLLETLVQVYCPTARIVSSNLKIH